LLRSDPSKRDNERIFVIYYKKTQSTIKELQEEKEKQVKDYISEFKKEKNTFIQETIILKEEINKKVEENNKVIEENQTFKDKIYNLTNEAKTIENNLSVVRTSLETKEEALNQNLSHIFILFDL